MEKPMIRRIKQNRVKQCLSNQSCS